MNFIEDYIADKLFIEADQYEYENKILEKLIKEIEGEN